MRDLKKLRDKVNWSGFDREKSREIILELIDEIEMRDGMVLYDSKTLKAAEGLCLRLPNKDPAIQFITYKEVEISTYEKHNRVRCIIDFKKPFINPNKD